jgi:bifunctional pyridoxal-dependent enzyme with beta-cystathionase and maltose regulon repressor activities
VAAFVAEPVIGAGGVYAPTEDYFRRVSEICNRYGVLFVSDGHLYWVRAADGRLIRRPLTELGPGTEQVNTASSASKQFAWGGNAQAVSGPNIDGVDWRTPGAFVREP